MNIPVSDIYEKSFHKFCSDVVESRILQNNEIFRMNKLLDLFVQAVQSTQDIDAGNCRTSILKNRLKRKYPQLKFHRPSKKNQSEIIFSDTSEDSFYNVWESAMGTETEYEYIERQTNNNRHQEDLTRLYAAAQLLNKSINTSSNETKQWPPEISELTIEAAKKMVPAVLFNFLA